MKSISAVAIFTSAELVSQFMADERLFPLLQVAAVTPFLYGFNNIGFVLYDREYNFRPKFVIRLSSRIIGLMAKIYLAIYLKNYWAFIYAEIIETVVFVLGSFLLHKYRPQFSLLGWKKQWGFSQWILLKSIFVFVRFRIDNIFLSKYLPLEGLGTYSVAKDVATLPSGQVIGPVLDPLYVGLSSIHNDAALFADKSHKTLSVMFAIILPISLGTYITADNLVAVLLGHQWHQAVPLVMILALTLLPAMLGDFLTRIMTALGKVKLIFKFELLLGLITVATFALLAKGMSLEQFAELRVALTSLNTLFVLYVLTLFSNLSFFRVIGLTLLPLLSSVIMGLFLMNINLLLENYNSLSQLCIQIISGGVVYLVFFSFNIYLLRNAIKEYQFIWKTFYVALVVRKK